MNRVTLKLASSVHAVTWDVLVTELMPVFGLERSEVNALLQADSIVLEPETAQEVQAVCDALGVAVIVEAMAPAPPPSWRRVVTMGCVALAALVLGLAGWRIVSQSGASAAAAESNTVMAEPPVIGSLTEPATADNPNAQLPVIESIAVDVPDLFTAARDLGVSEVRASLVRAARVDIRDSYGQTPLMYAAGHNNVFVVRELIMSGADVNARTDAAWTPLMYAVRNTQFPEILEVLLAAGADPMLRNEAGETALMVAEREGGAAQRELLTAVTVVDVPVPTAAVQVTPPPQPRPVAARPRPLLRRLTEDTLEQRQRELIIACINDWENCDAN
jgi:hypothetical protein